MSLHTVEERINELEDKSEEAILNAAWEDNQIDVWKRI